MHVGGDGKLIAVTVKNTDSGLTEELLPGAMFVFIGLDPNTGFLKGTINLDDWGFIKTSGTLETSVKGVFAAGDVRAVSTKQVVSAAGQGATAAPIIRQIPSRLMKNGECSPPQADCGESEGVAQIRFSSFSLLERVPKEFWKEFFNTLLEATEGSRGYKGDS